MTKRLAVFASGTGTNFSALDRAIKDRQIPAEIVLLVCDHEQAPVVQRAQEAHIPTLIVDFHAYSTKVAAENWILRNLKENQVDAVLLAGYMRIVGPTLLQGYPHRILNLHPALLPKFPGRHGIADALAAGVRETGVTVHFVDAGVDTGEIIAQRVVPVNSGDTVASLATRIHDAEHDLYPTVLQRLIDEDVL
ncbi:phosphoribosylglycinamide formyltransferase [Levilactobacillus tongjiangensis]|uniref:Phosphoribosylglycinamide formyltransferase n=1 Tax=Levilactobacillus tongjiangensis TaxID=2486023 RepID=A0ABW1SNI3_9LACO|nr:phosphoribosylglycinamide formyltransferase [Levilactobacillus tongjiangensis]